MEANVDKKRIWELDFVRGIALILMIYFHIIFDLKDIYAYPVNYASGFNYYVGKVSVILFILISGISCYLSKSNVKRGLRVLAVALIITLATHLFDKELGVKFGVLHFFGISMMLFPLFKNLKPYLLILLGTGIIIIGNLFTRITLTHDYFFMFNLTSPNFTSSDYYPLLPWFGIFLYGISIGKIFYLQKKSLFSFTPGENLISRIGRNTMIVYIIHQPVIIGVLEIISRIKPQS